MDCPSSILRKEYQKVCEEVTCGLRCGQKHDPPVFEREGAAPESQVYLFFMRASWPHILRSPSSPIFACPSPCCLCLSPPWCFEIAHYPLQTEICSAGVSFALLKLRDNAQWRTTNIEEGAAIEMVKVQPKPARLGFRQSQRAHDCGGTGVHSLRRVRRLQNKRAAPGQYQDRAI